MAEERTDLENTDRIDPSEYTAEDDTSRDDVLDLRDSNEAYEQSDDEVQHMWHHTAYSSQVLHTNALLAWLRFAVITPSHTLIHTQSTTCTNVDEHRRLIRK